MHLSLLGIPRPRYYEKFRPPQYAVANYFTASDLPFEMSPAFFRPDVLLKYKGDSEKYRLEDRSITCRNAWHLETYDINDAGQVHTYLIYLQRLPYDEQLYWKSYNEKPKSSISKRAFTTDFEGNWYNEYDALASLKEFAFELDHERVPWVEPEVWSNYHPACIIPLQTQRTNGPTKSFNLTKCWWKGLKRNG